MSILCWRRWVPEDYRARALTLIHATFSLGTVVGMLVTPQLVAPFGWPGALKGFTLLGLAWMVSSCPRPLLARCLLGATGTRALEAS